MSDGLGRRDTAEEMDAYGLHFPETETAPFSKAKMREPRYKGESLPSDTRQREGLAMEFRDDSPQLRHFLGDAGKAIGSEVFRRAGRLPASWAHYHLDGQFDVIRSIYALLGSTAKGLAGQGGRPECSIVHEVRRYIICRAPWPANPLRSG